MSLPSAVLDLSVWKLTLPSGTKGHPTELTSAQLVTYTGSPYVGVNAAGNGVSFSAPVNGVTTSGSKYPRSELREMTKNGKNAAWTGKTGWHVLTVVESFDHLPLVKPHLVGAQIHDDKKDWTVFRLEGTKLYVTASDNTHFKLVTDHYVLGTPYVAQYVVAANKISAYYNGVLQTTLDATKLKGAYFKAGVYTQANCTNSSPCSATNYGQTTIYSVSVIHADKPGTLPVPSVPGQTPGPVPTPVPVPVPTPSGQTLGVGGIPTPAPGPNVFLAVADSTAPLNITKPGIYDGLGHKVGRVTVKASGVTVQNYRIVAGGQYGAVLDANDIVFQNNDITGITPSGDGDMNAITGFGSKIKIKFNTAINFVTGDPGGSHTDFIQTWVSSSHPNAASDWEVVGNKAVGPPNPKRDSNVPSIHQWIMVEGAGLGGNSGGSGKPSRWLIADNIVSGSWNQEIKIDGGVDFTITRNRFEGSSTKVMDVSSASSGVKFYSDNIVGPGYGSVGVPIAAGPGPGRPGPTPVPTPAPTTGPVILLVRHGEKDDDGNGADDVLHQLSTRGAARAKALPPLFTAPRADLVRPTWMFASKGTGAGLRMEQTATPTANALHVPLDVSLDSEVAIDATATLLVGKAKAGEVVLAVLEHSAIPAVLKAVAKLLGTTDKTPSSHADDDFTTGYKFIGTRFSTFQESVLSGDPGYHA